MDTSKDHQIIPHLISAFFSASKEAYVAHCSGYFTDYILLRDDGSHVVQVQGGCPAPVAAAVDPQEDGGVLGMGVGDHHVEVEAVLAQRRICVPLLRALKAWPHLVLDLDAGVGKPRGLSDPLPLVNRPGVAKPEVTNIGE